jgi:cellobiose phosphorylase
MYTHAHLRYAEALAHYGDAEGFFLALCQAIPIGIKTLVPSAAPRQANCYFFSSDAAFPDRYQAYAGYQRVMNGAVPLEGGWRVYSSGAGIATALILGCLFGLRQGKSWLVVDPVIPRPLDNMRVMLRLAETTCEVIYTVRGAGCGPSKVVLNGAELPFTRGANPYRTGAAIISMAAFRGGLTAGTNLLTIDVG